MSTGVLVGPGAASVRRTVGPTAWAALETLVDSSSVGAGGLVVTTSVRELAAVLGVSKNTAHRAMRRLAAAGVVVAHQSRSLDGRFTRGTYLVVVPSDVLQPLNTEPVAPVMASRRTPRRRAATGQLDLLASA